MKVLTRIIPTLLFLMAGSVFSYGETKVSQAAYWSFDQYEAGRTFKALTDMNGLYLRASDSRMLTIEANALSGTFSDGSSWSVKNVGTKTICRYARIAEE